MNASFTKSLSVFSQPVFWIRLTAGLIALVIFSTFRLLSAQDSERTIKAVSGVLRNEYATANSYALAKSISDLEILGILNCTRLTEKTEITRIFYDSSKNRSCFQNKFLASILRQEIQLKAINGLSYQLAFQISPSLRSLLLELLCYLVTVIGGFALASQIRTRELKAQLRLAALEYDKELALDNAKQVRHDVAAPIGALRMILQAAKNLDPEVQGILFKAITRTEQIFDRLNSDETPSTSPTCIFTAIKEVVDEKKATWGTRCGWDLNLPDTSIRVVANAEELKSIFSNLLNNAYEAQNSGEARIRISLTGDSQKVDVFIQDNGIGMTPQTLEKIGMKGFTSGKTGFSNSGSGLGVYNAKKLVHSWGGSLQYLSTPRRGTVAQLSFRVTA